MSDFPLDCLGVCIEFLSSPKELFRLIMTSRDFCEYILANKNPHATNGMSFYYRKRRGKGRKKKSKKMKWVNALLYPENSERPVYKYVKRVQIDRKMEDPDFMASFPNASFVDMQLNYMLPGRGFNNFGHVKYLNLYWCQTLRDESFAHMESIEVLDISGCKGITGKAIENLLEFSPKLKLINVCNAGSKNASLRMSEGNRKLYSIGGPVLQKLRKERNVKVVYQRIFEYDSDDDEDTLLRKVCCLLPMFRDMFEEESSVIRGIRVSRKKPVTFEELLQRNFDKMKKNGGVDEQWAEGIDSEEEEDIVDDDDDMR